MIWENIKLALAAIRSNKMRSILTMLGIIIGIASVIAIVSVGTTVKGLVVKEYESFGTGGVIFWAQDADGITLPMTKENLAVIEEAFGDQLLMIDTSSGNEMTAKHNLKTTDVALAGKQKNYEKVKPVNILYGRSIDQNDMNSKANHIVIEKKLADTLYGYENVVGQQLILRNKSGEQDTYLIVGVYEDNTSVLMKLLNPTQKSSIFIADSAISNRDTFYQVTLYADPKMDPTLLETQLRGIVSRMMNVEKKNIVYYSVNQEMTTITGALNGISVGIACVAAISLLVGGIGIMNIMLVSVTERTREIGIRKALGAKTRDILSQFLIESAIISMAGGIIGTGLGFGLVFLAGLALNITATINPVAVVVAVGFSVMVGLFFGIMPARKAANYDPIEALRYE